MSTILAATLSAAVLAQAAWIEDHTEYRFRRDLPRVEVIPVSRWPDRVARGGCSNAISVDLRGCYTPDLIELRAAPMDELLPMLVHELVHHAQELAGERGRCDSETRAYAVQAEWQVRNSNWSLTVDFPSGDAHRHACQK